MRRKPAILGRVKLYNTLLNSGQGNFNQITAQSGNQILVIVVRDTYIATENQMKINLGRRLFSQNSINRVGKALFRNSFFLSS